VSDSKAQSRQRAIDYLSRLLQMNPVSQGEEIIALRTKAFHRQARKSSPSIARPEAVFDKRRVLLEKLEAVRTNFWQLPLPLLQQELSQLDATEFPDVHATVKRLHTVANHREGFPVLAQMRGFDGDLFGAIKKVLVAPARETAILREQVLSSFQKRARNKKGRRMVRLLEKEMPEVYRLETDWFNALKRQKVKDFLSLPRISLALIIFPVLFITMLIGLFAMMVGD